jgi:hypothetical protein
MATPNPNGNPDSFFIARVRRDIKDVPVTLKDPFTGDGITGGFSAGAQPWRTSKQPIINPTREALQPGAGVVVTVAAAVQTIVYDSAVTPPAGTVNVITETGELYFGTVPTAGQAILVTYQAARNGTQAILEALTEGMNQLYPEIYQEAVDTTTVVLTPTTTEYTLASIFNDPRVEVTQMEVAPPSGIITYFDTGLFETVGANEGILRVAQAWPPGSVVRLTYNAPYQALSDVETQAMWLPVYYAISTLQEEQEVARSRQADLIALAGEGGTKPGDAAATADRWMNKFLAGKAQLARPEPTSKTVKDRIVERLPYMRATGFSWNPF